MRGSYLGQNLAARSFNDAYAAETGRRQAYQQEEADARLRLSLADLGPDATREQMTSAAAPALARSPGQGSALMGLYAGDIASREAVAAAQAKQKAEIEKEGRTHTYRLEEIGAQQDRQDTRASRTEAGADRRSSQADARAAADRENRNELEIARLLGNGDVDAARIFAQRVGSEVDPSLWETAATDRDFREVLKLISDTGDPEYGDRLLKAFNEEGTMRGALSVAGAPPRKASKAANTSSVERIADRLVSEGMEYQEALDYANRAKVNPEVEAARLAEKAAADARSSERDAVRQETYNYWLQQFKEERGGGTGGDDPLGLGTGGADDDPLGLFD